MFKNNYKRNGLIRQAMQRLLKNKIGLICLSIIICFYLAGALASWITPYDYNEQNIEIKNTEGKMRGCLACNPPSLKHPFGTDRLGRDVLTRIIFGLRTTVIITIASIVTGGLILGITFGLISGYFGGKIDTLIMRIGEIFLAFPGLLLVLLIAATVRPRVTSWVRIFETKTGIEGIITLGIVDYLVVFGAMAAFSWVGMSRLVRGQVLQIKKSQFIEASIASGASTFRILFSHILPNILPALIVVISMGMGSAVGTEIILSWLGIGIQPPTPSIGVMIYENGNLGVLRSNPHLILFPIAIVTILIFTFNLLGDALNDAFNPRIY